MPGPPWSRKIGSAGSSDSGADALHRQGDEPRLRVGPVLGHDERPAVGRVAAVLGSVGARLQRQIACLRAGRHGDCISGADSEVAEAEDDEPDEQEPDDAAGRERALPRDVTCAGFGSACGAPSASSSRSGSPKSSCGSHSSHLGRYQFQSPSSFIVAGSSTARTIVASMRIGRREPDAELLEERHRERAEDREHADHDDRGARDDAGGGPDAVGDRLVRALPATDRLADPADDEHVVVHREAEEDHEQQQRHHGLDPVRGADAEQALADAVLEDEHEHAVGGGHRQQVEDDRLDRDHDRAECDQHQHEREQEDERDDRRQVRPQLVGLVLP